LAEKKNLPARPKLKTKAGNRPIRKGRFSARGGQVRAGGREGLGGIPPALQILGEICSNFFKRTPFFKSTLWLGRTYAQNKIEA